MTSFLSRLWWIWCLEEVIWVRKKSFTEVLWGFLFLFFLIAHWSSSDFTFYLFCRKMCVFKMLFLVLFNATYQGLELSRVQFRMSIVDMVNLKLWDWFVSRPISYLIRLISLHILQCHAMFISHTVLCLVWKVSWTNAGAALFDEALYWPL